jgi:hypothetical protein
MTFHSNFWTVETLEPFLEAIEKRFITGPIIKVKTGAGQETEFDTRNVDIQKIQDAILDKLNQLDPENYPAPSGNRRSGVTLSYFQ